jgi:hypothetical protein
MAMSVRNRRYAFERRISTIPGTIPTDAAAGTVTTDSNKVGGRAHSFQPETAPDDGKIEIKAAVIRASANQIDGYRRRDIR